MKTWRTTMTNLKLCLLTMGFLIGGCAVHEDEHGHRDGAVQMATLGSCL